MGTFCLIEPSTLVENSKSFPSLTLLCCIMFDACDEWRGLAVVVEIEWSGLAVISWENRKYLPNASQ